MKLIKRMCIIVFFAFLADSIAAQTAASYLYYPTSEPFVSIAESGIPANFTGDDYFQTSIPIGFTFDYCGINYYYFYASSNGYISLPNILPSSGAPSANNSIFSLFQLNNGIGMICPFWDDLDGLGRSAYYLTTGISPNRIFTIEWNSFGLYGGLGGPTNDSLTFQIKLFEQNGLIQFCYGHSMVYSTLGATIGIINSTADFQTLNDCTPTAVPSSSVFTTNISSFPLIGQVYNWIPPIVNVSKLNKDDGVLLYQVPHSSQLIIVFSREQKYAVVKIFDLAGREVKTISCSGKILSIDYEETSKEIYLIQIIDENNNVVNKKIITQ